ncbi:hypothetical protein ACWKWF_08150 [Acinetobacter kookii]
MSVLTKEELRYLLTITSQENEELKKDNQRLLLIIADATGKIKKANDMAEGYQRMCNELLEVIKSQYDAKFTVEDIPRYLN